VVVFFFVVLFVLVVVVVCGFVLAHALFFPLLSPPPPPPTQPQIGDGEWVTRSRSRFFSLLPPSLDVGPQQSFLGVCVHRTSTFWLVSPTPKRSTPAFSDSCVLFPTKILMSDLSKSS